MKMRISAVPLVLAAALATPGPPVWAQGGGHPVAQSASAGISIDQAVRMAEQRFKARVVRAESEQDGGHTIYVLRMLNESGRVWTVRVDASSGALL
jgi:uncharacterized membrane protein YkoI